MTHGNIKISEQLPSQTKLDGCQSVSKFGFWNGVQRSANVQAAWSSVALPHFAWQWSDSGRRRVLTEAVTLQWIFVARDAVSQAMAIRRFVHSSIAWHSLFANAWRLLDPSEIGAFNSDEFVGWIRSTEIAAEVMCRFVLGSGVLFLFRWPTRTN